MSYESVDILQNLLANTIFSHTIDKKKAAGRALGTFIEIITYYLLKTWNFEKFTSIERPLPEYGNDEICHNVEFTLHGSKLIISKDIDLEQLPISISKLFKNDNQFINSLKKKNNIIIDKNGIIRNACTIYNNEHSFINAYFNSAKNQVEIYELKNKPFAMFECKRVGVEEGNKKGPQTIEKAKQGSYVARTVSSLQKIRFSNGKIGGIIHKPDGKSIIEDYYKLLETVIKSDDINLLNNFILTIGVVSNHGNWFTSDNPNKEMKVLSQSYDWLLFLTDKGISEFITDLLIKPKDKYSSIKQAFQESYIKDKKGNVFTKVKIEQKANKTLINYFSENINKIENWFNIISPQNKKIEVLKKEIKTLTEKKWEVIYK